MFRLTNEADKRLHFAVASCKLSDGLLVQLEEYLKEYPDSRLIVIDTLQKIRTASKDNAYANDYVGISLVKDFADRHSLAVVVVHHIRKQNDSDVFNKVSGTMRRIQIRETIQSHFEKEEKLFDMGIKTLSLFFIDEVAKYRQYDEDGNELLGEYLTDRISSQIPEKVSRPSI